MDYMLKPLIKLNIDMKNILYQAPAISLTDSELSKSALDRRPTWMDKHTQTHRHRHRHRHTHTHTHT